MWNLKSFYLESMKKKVRLHIYSKKNRQKLHEFTLWDRSQGVFLLFLLVLSLWIVLGCFSACSLPLSSFSLYILKSNIWYFSQCFDKNSTISMNIKSLGVCVQNCGKLKDISVNFCATRMKISTMVQPTI